MGATDLSLDASASSVAGDTSAAQADDAPARMDEARVQADDAQAQATQDVQTPAAGAARAQAGDTSAAQTTPAAGAAHVPAAQAPVLKHAELIGRMTLAQKCALLSGATSFGTQAYPELGVPELYFSDGPNGLRKQAGAADHLGLNPSEPATCFPTASAVASSWDPSVAAREGKAMGVEAAAQGVNVVLGPGLNIKRNPLCGRNFEYYSEDPLLAGTMAAAFVRGMQETGVSACPKHFAVNSQETRRMASDSIIDERTEREIYLPGFEHAVREGKPLCLMTSYNLVNGSYANENEHLLHDVLYGEWGFSGAVVTDWGGSNDHVAGVAAGSAFEMPAPGGDSVRELMAAVRDGRLSEAVLNERVGQALDLVFATHEATERARGGFDSEAHHALARELAAQCAVLLKNDDELLPLAAGTKVALIGDFANTPRFQGAGSSAVNATRVESMLGLMGQSGLACVGYEPGFDRLGGESTQLREAACALAAKAEVAILCLGTTEIQESEGTDRLNMRLNENQCQLVLAVSAVCPRVVVVLASGAPVELPWLAQVPALLWTGLGGQAGAGAVLDILCGKLAPSGKLAETWPVRYEDVPGHASFPSEAKTVEYREGPYVGYRYYDTTGAPVAFPFGHGLSYARFSYADLAMGAASAQGIPAEASLTLTNEGAMAAAEVVQLYVAHKGAVFGPAQQLAGFAKLRLAPGESRRVTIAVDPHAFMYWNVATHAWELEGGSYELRCAASSRDVRLVAAVELQGSGAPNPYESVALGPYETGEVAQVDDASFAALLGHEPPAARPCIDRGMTLGELGCGRSPIGWIAGAVIGHLYRKSQASGTPDLNITFVYNMPLRAIAKMTGGMVSMGMVDAIVMELRGFWIIGILRLAVEFVLNLVRNRALARELASHQGL